MTVNCPLILTNLRLIVCLGSIYYLGHETVSRIRPVTKFVYTQKDKLVRLAVLPIFLLLINTILLQSRYVSDWQVFIITTGISFAFYFGHWFINNAIALWAHQRYPSYQHFTVRILISASLANIVSLLTTLLVIWIYEQVGYTVPMQRRIWALLFVFFMVVLVTAIYEGINAFEQWRRYFIESEQLKKAQLHSELEALKQQVNPHFLFNSLNILDALIDDDPKQAHAFLDELSSVYRYLLRSNEQNLTPLSAELDFIYSYYHLLQTRHGQGLQLITSINPQYVNYHLPPLTLQLLVENAVKHNVILPGQPLTIAIETDEQARLMVRNNLQRKSSRVVSNGVGLSNILTKYRILSQIQPLVHDDGQSFVVTLPLIPN